MNDGLEQRIYSRGTKMSEIPLQFRGLTLLEWQALWIHEQCEAYLASLGTIETRNQTAPLINKRVYTARDGYGMKSILRPAQFSALQLSL